MERPGHRLLELEYDNMLACVRCGLCASVCPTYQETLVEEQSPRGRIAIARALTEGHLSITSDLLQAMDSCLLCEACTAICPSGVHMDSIGEAVRDMTRAQSFRPVSWRERLARRAGFHVLEDPHRLRSFTRLTRFYQRSGLRALAQRSGALRLFGLERADALLPDLPDRFFVASGQVWRPTGQPRCRVALLAGCVMSTAFAETDRATVEVLIANGCEVVAPAGQACCGAIHAHSGELAAARKLARRNIDAFRDLAPDAIIVNAAGCGSTLKSYGRLLADDPEYAQAAQEFAAKVRDITEFLDALPLEPPPGRVDAIATLQEPCHLSHAQGIRAAPRRLLRAIPGLTLVEMAESDRCCGSAGIYNLTQPEMADALLRRKVENILATHADLVITANPGCQMQLQAGLRAAGSSAKVVHIIDVLAQAYRGTPR